jgi:hypothetical protein
VFLRFRVHIYRQSFHGYDLYGFSFILERIAGRTPIFAFHKNFSTARIDRGKRVHSFSRHRSRRLRRASVGCGYFPNCNRRSSHFKVAEDAIKLSLEQEERVSKQIDALVSMARAAHFMNDFKTGSESDTTIENFLQWFVKKQSEEVVLMRQLLRAIQPAGEGNLLRAEEHLAREGPWNLFNRTRSNRYFHALSLVRNRPRLQGKV